jgi:hypothetical protein
MVGAVPSLDITDKHNVIADYLSRPRDVTSNVNCVSCAVRRDVLRTKNDKVSKDRCLCDDTNGTEGGTRNYGGHGAEGDVRFGRHGTVGDLLDGNFAGCASPTNVADDEDFFSLFRNFESL